MTSYSIRHAVRVLLLDEEARVLLLHVDDGAAYHHNRPQMVTFWITPGGGIETGEDHAAALRRELYEETGLTNAGFGPCLWQLERLVHLPRGSMLSLESVYLAHVCQAQVTLDNLLPYEQRLHTRFHWWRLEEIAQSQEYFMPPALATLLPPILAGDYPAKPVAINCTP